MLVDSGADDELIDSSLVKLCDLALVELSAPKKVLAINSCKHCGYVVERGQFRSDPVKVMCLVNVFVHTGSGDREGSGANM